MAGLSDADRRLIAAVADGLPSIARPYSAIGKQIGMTEAEVIEGLRRLIADGVITRFGVVVRHRALGYRANAMVVWDVPDTQVDAIGRRLAALPYVTLCYQRPRRPPTWPYNLFCMIHGRDRAAVEAQIAEASAAAGIEDRPRAVLFSKRCFKQKGAHYGAPPKPSEAA